MSFFNEIKSALGLDVASDALSYHIINYAGEAVFVEGFKRLATISGTEIILALKKDYIKITGENLSVFSLEETCITVKGKIRATEVVAI